MRRSTSGIIWRILVTLVAAAAVHAIARLLYMQLGIGTEYSRKPELRTFESFGTDVMDSFMLVSYHFMAAFVVAFVIVAIVMLLFIFHWIVFEEKKCSNAKCGCSNHSGMTFDEELGRWVNPPRRDPLVQHESTY